jgi:hypothetical protein
MPVRRGGRALHKTEFSPPPESFRNAPEFATHKYNRNNSFYDVDLKDFSSYRSGDTVCVRSVVLGANWLVAYPSREGRFGTRPLPSLPGVLFSQLASKRGLE